MKYVYVVWQPSDLPKLENLLARQRRIDDAYAWECEGCAYDPKVDVELLVDGGQEQ